MSRFYKLLLLIFFCFSCDKFDTSVKLNAVIIGFNPDKCSCCWGWTIKTDNDTIKSDNAIIGETIGYDIQYPVNVYIEIGELEEKCSDLEFTNSELLRDYYKVIKIEKIE